MITNSIKFISTSIFFVLILIPFASGEKSTYVDQIKFVQYLDENTALEEVRNNNLHIYYYRISSDRIENTESRQNLNIYESTGGSYSLLVNPAKTEPFNPFSISDVRFALNYLVDRKLIVNELMGGYGTTMISNYGPFDPEYLTIIDVLQKYNFRYNPALAEEIIAESLEKNGAAKTNDQWMINGDPIEVTIFIRSDDPVRKSIGEIISSELSSMGFKVNKEFGDLNKAFVVVYGSNPADSKWHLYTEGWGGRSAFVRYDSVGLGQMYAPWFSNMPGFNDPSYWNYQNEKLDEVTQRIYTGEFASKAEREELIRQATIEGINESVRIFLASKIDQYVTNESVDGVVNDFGAGVPSRFTPINAKSDSELLRIGVKQIYQGAWNPVGGLSDAYSKHIWDVLFDPALFKDPYNGKTIPIRLDWKVQTNGPDGKVGVPEDVITWNSTHGQWERVKSGSTATSKVTFDIVFSDWHNGIPMDMKDLLYSFYFTMEWGSPPTEEDKTFDTEFTPRATQLVKTLKGIRVVDDNTIEVYVDYWHFDEGEIADWASIWSSMPLEVFTAMEQAVLDGKVSFSRSGAVSKNVNWLSLIVPNDANILKQYLQDFRKNDFVPKALQKFEGNPAYYDKRYESSIGWISKYNHAVISNGPFYLENYSPESRTITINAFADESYPFESGKWSKFEDPKIPQITSIDHLPVLVKDESFDIEIKTAHATALQYFMINSDGDIVEQGNKKIDNESLNLHLDSEKTGRFEKGAADLKLFAVSQDVLRPDFYTTSVLVTEKGEDIPQIQIQEGVKPIEKELVWILVVAVIVVFAIVLLYTLKKKMTRSTQYDTP